MTKTQETVERMQKLAAEVMAEGKASRLEGAGGPTKSANTLAIAAIAEQDGVKPGSVRQRVVRAKKESTKVPWVFNDLGMALDPEWLAKVLLVREQLTKVADKVQSAKGMLTAMVNRGAPLPGRIARAKEELSELASLIRGMRPVAVCYYCKGLAGVVEECAACETLGYCTEATESGVPAQYKDTESPMVLHRTKTVSVVQFAAKVLTAPLDEPLPW